MPHAVRELSALGVAEAVLAAGVATREVCFYTSHGQLVECEPRGRFAGHDSPQISTHRADLHDALLRAVRERLGHDAVRLGRRCAGVDQDDAGVTVRFTDGEPVRASVAVGCDGIHSVVRRQLWPNESATATYGTTQFRGVTVWQPFLSGASMVYVGTYDAGKLVAYPIRLNVDAHGRSLTNWVVEIQRPGSQLPDWNRTATAGAFVDALASWSFDWLDVPAMIRAASAIFEYPVVDREPLDFWTDRRVTLLGDAAHPMLPRGSNGAAQAVIDARVLAAALAACRDPREALAAYEAERRPATANVVIANRTESPDAILRVVEERTGGKPFDDIDGVISPDERAQWHARYRSTAGFERTKS